MVVVVNADLNLANCAMLDVYFLIVCSERPADVKSRIILVRSLVTSVSIRRRRVHSEPQR